MGRKRENTLAHEPTAQSNDKEDAGEVVEKPASPAAANTALANTPIDLLSLYKRRLLTAKPVAKKVGPKRRTKVNAEEPELARVTEVSPMDESLLSLYFSNLVILLFLHSNSKVYLLRTTPAMKRMKRLRRLNRLTRKN